MLIFIIMFSKIEWISELCIHRILYSQDINAKPIEWIEKIKFIYGYKANFCQKESFKID